MTNTLPTIAPSMSVTQIAELLEAHRTPGVDVYVRIESVRGKPVAFLVRERENREWIPPVIRRQAE
jgi:hypothetical protein